MPKVGSTGFKNRYFRMCLTQELSLKKCQGKVILNRNIRANKKKLHRKILLEQERK